MKREELMNALSAENDDKMLIADILEADVDFLDRQIKDIEYSIKDSEKELKKRLRAKTEIDSSVVEVMYSGLSALKSKVDLYKNFKKEYFTNEAR